MSINILAITPARGGSKLIPKKNIKNLLGKPLLAYTYDEVKKSKYINRIILSTEDEEIKEIGIKTGFEVPFMRPIELSRDDTPSLPVIQHAVRYLKDNENYRPDIIVLLQATSPLRTVKHIDEAINLYLKNGTDSLVSVIPVPHNMNPYSIMKLNNDILSPFLNYDEKNNIRQKKPKFFARNGAAIYVFSYDCLMKKNSFFGDSTIAFPMKKIESFDIDDEIDWKIIELILKREIK